MNKRYDAFLGSYLENLLIPQVNTETTHTSYIISSYMLLEKSKELIAPIRVMSNPFSNHCFSFAKNADLYISRLHLLYNIENFIHTKYLSNSNLLATQIPPYAIAGANLARQTAVLTSANNESIINIQEISLEIMKELKDEYLTATIVPAELVNKAVVEAFEKVGKKINKIEDALDTITETLKKITSP